jgi:hypothetical protein
MSDEDAAYDDAIATRAMEGVRGMTAEERRNIERHAPAQETLDVVNAILMTCSAMGGYAMGIACADAWARGEEPTFDALDKASRSRGVGT